MAEGGVDPLSESLQKLDDELTCPVCTDHFKEPKVLPCLHYYCKTCIADLIKRAKGRPFNCPECRREVQASNNDANSFPTAFFMNRMEELFLVMKKADPKEDVKCESCTKMPSTSFCHECKEYICSKCVNAHRQLHKLSSHNIVSIESFHSNVSKGRGTNLPMVHRDATCAKHTDEPLKLYCRDCHKLVCRDCILIDHKHHRYAFVTDAAPLCKAEIRDMAMSVKKISEGLKVAAKAVSDSEKKLSDHGTASMRAIDNALDEVVAKAAQKRKELKDMANSVLNEAREKVSTQEKNAQLAVGEVDSLFEFMNRILERATNQEVLNLEKQISDQVQRMTKNYGNTAEMFPVPKLPELVVTCGEGVTKAIETEISVTEKGVTKPLEISPGTLFFHSIDKYPTNLERAVIQLQVKLSTDKEREMLIFLPTIGAKPNWSEECKMLVHQYLSKKMTTEKVNIPKEAASQAIGLLVSLIPGLFFDPGNEGTEITVAGEAHCVSKAKVALNSLYSDLVTDTASILLSPEDFDFVEQVKQHDFPSNVECTFDSSKFSLVLKGPKGEVMKMKDSMEDVVSHSDTPVLLDPMVTEFFKTPTGRGKVEKFLQERQCRAALHFSQTPTLLLHLLSDRKEANKVRAVVAQLHLLVTSQGIPIPVKVVPIIADFEEFIQLCRTTEKKYEVLVKCVGHDVTAAGFKGQVSSTLTAIKAFLDRLASPIPPLEIKVSTLVAKSLHKSQHGLQKCLESVRLYCDTGRGVLQLTPLHYLKPGWEETCKERVSGYVNKNIADLKVSVPGEAYSEVMKELYVSEQDDDTFVYHYPPSATSLSLAGRPDIVRMMQEKIVHICASHSFTREEVPLKPEEYEFITQLQMEHLISKFRTVEIEAVPETYSLTLSGPAKGVKVVKEHIPSITKIIVSVHVDMDKAVVQYLGTENGREKLIGLLREKRADKCAVCISGSPATLSLVCAQKYKNMTEKASKSITGTTSRQPVDIPDMLVPVLPQLPEFATMVKSLERELPVMVTVEGKSVVVAGFKDGVMHAADNLSAFVKQKMIHFQPVVIPVDPMIALCMQNSQESLQACMSSIHVTYKLECSKHKSTATMYPSRETKSDWKKECQSLFSSYVSKEYSTETIEIPKEAARSVFPILASAKTKHNFHFEMDDDGECATVAGERSSVEAVKKKIDRIFTQTQTTETRKLSQRDYEYFTQVVQKNLTSETDIELSPEMHSLTATGSVHAVSAVMKSMQETVQYDVVPVSVDEIMVQFIRTQGRKRLENLMLQQRIEAAIHVDISANPATLELLCKTQTGQHVRSFAETFPKNIEITAFPLPKTVTRPPISHEFSQYCKELAVEHEVSIILKPDTIQICGFKDDSSEVLKSVERFIKKKCTVSRAFTIQKGMWRLLGGPMKGKWIKIDNMCRDSEVSLALPSDYDEKLVINFKGDKSEVLKAIEAMNTLITSIETATVSLKRPEIQRYFSEKEGIERNARVCIELCVAGEDEEWGVEEGVTPTDEAEFKAVARPVPKQSKVCTAHVVGMKRITIHVGDITEFRADVIVNVANEDLKHIGGVADSVLKKGGQAIQDASDRYRKSHGKLSAGDVWLSPVVGRLPCLALVHAVGPRWQGNPAGRQQLRKVCINSLKAAKDYNSIAIPAISSGMFGCPMDQCAEVMISATVEFCRKAQATFPLDDINIVLFQQSDAIHFIRQLKVYLPPENIQHKGSANSSCHAHGSPQPQPQSRYFGSQSLDLQNGVTVEIVKGDITLEKTDVIVNTTDEQMSLGGGVGAALARRAGKGLQEACRKVKPYNKSSLRDGKVIETKPGNLNCKCVLHMMFQKHNFVEVIVTCIEKARGLKFRSIAFPAVGTGAERFPVEDAAKGMLKGLQKCRASTQMNVRIVLLDDTYHKFIAALEGQQQPWYQRAIKAIGGLVPWGSTPADKDDEEPMDVDSSNDLELRIYGETQEYVKSAKESLYSLINRQFKTEEIEDERIGLFSESQKVYLQKEAHKMQLTFRMDRNLNLIELKGSKESISEMKFKVHAVMTKVESEANREKQAETMKKTIKWLRQDSNDPDYEPLTNLEIEEKYHASGGKSDYTFKDDVSVEHFTIDFQKMIEIDHTMGDKTCEVRRVTTGIDVLPVDWESMTDPSSKKEVPLRVIDLATSSRGYQFVLKEFNKTMTQGLNYTAIVKIQRIQNPALYGQYASKKKNLDLHNLSSVQNERWLFHGTKQSVISHINQTNFNRSLSGQNGTMYGRGCYFARDASYSNRYASPDAQGQKCMYLVRVLTGEYTTGSGTMMVAPPKDPKDPTVPFDSVVDDATNPGIFVVFFDAGAYPEYLITYQ